MSVVPVEQTLLSGPLSDEVVEVVGVMDGQPMFFGRMCANRLRGGYDVSSDPAWWPGNGRPQGWRPSRERAIRWMQERKGL